MGRGAVLFLGEVDRWGGCAAAVAGARHDDRQPGTHLPRGVSDFTRAMEVPVLADR